MENTLHEILGNLTPSELDELANAGFDARAPRGVLKRIEKSAIEKAGVRPAKRKRYFKPLMIAAAVIIFGALFTASATRGNFVKFFAGGKEVEGEYRDYVDHDGYRHVSFEAVVPIDLENYAILIDVDEPDYEKAVQVFTEENAPELFERIAENYYEHDKIERERNALKAAGVPEDELPVLYYNLDLGIEMKFSEYLAWSWHESYYDDNGKEWKTGWSGTKGGEFMSVSGKSSECRSYTKSHKEDGTRTIREEFYYYVGEQKQE